MFDCNSIIINNKDDKQYAYEKAIEAYWKHVDRYHTWMNYYAIFNGALFVGFCTLLTASTEIVAKSSIKDDIELLNATSISFENPYSFLLIILCFVGIITSFCWLLSLKGHMIWMNNWMRIIKKYEKENVYSIILASESEFRLEGELKRRTIFYNEYYKAFSTSSITKVFIVSIIIGWIFTYVYILITDICKNGCSILNVSTSSPLILVLIFYCFLKYSSLFVDKELPPIKWKKFFYSNVYDKTIYIVKDNIAVISDDNF